MQVHPNSERLKVALKACVDETRPWEWLGTLYRATTVKYANSRDLLTGIGSKRAGGRWTPPGLFPSVYGCLEPETAMAERFANYRENGIPVSQALPLVFVGVTVRVQRALDISDAYVQKKLRLTTRQMIEIDWRAEQEAGREAITQAIGRLAYELRLEGIFVPSARRHGATNIVLFPSRRLKGSSWKIQQVRDLPKSAR